MINEVTWLEHNEWSQKMMDVVFAYFYWYSLCGKNVVVKKNKPYVRTPTTVIMQNDEKLETNGRGLFNTYYIHATFWWEIFNPYLLYEKHSF